MNEFQLFDTLGFLTINTAFRAKQNLNSIFQKNGMNATVDQFVILSVLLVKDGIVQKEISEQCDKSDSNLTRILNVMENRSLIQRQAGKDARSRNIFLTEAGIQLYQKLAPIVAVYNQSIFEGLSEEKLDTYKDVLMHMREKLMKGRND